MSSGMIRVQERGFTDHISAITQHGSGGSNNVSFVSQVRIDNSSTGMFDSIFTMSNSTPNMEVWTYRATTTPDESQIFRSFYFLNTYSGKWFRWSISYMLVPVINLVIILSNMVNIAIFLKVGVRDGASIIFLALSLSDMLYSSLYFVNATLRGSQFLLGKHPYVRLAHLAFVIGPYRRMFFDISILITIFAGIQKCACVAIALTFRNFFTFKKSAVTLVSISFCATVYYMPQLCNVYMGARLDHSLNRTRLMVKMSNYGMARTLQRISKSINRVSLPIIAEIILIFCVSVMSYKLRQAADTRQAMKSGTDIVVQGGQSADTKEVSGDSKGSNLSKKELRVIHSVNIVCAIFIAGTAPRCFIEACDLALEDFGDYTVPQSLYNFLNSFQEVIIGLSTAANIVVYFKFNSKYRETFLGVFSCFQRKDNKSAR